MQLGRWIHTGGLLLGLSLLLGGCATAPKTSTSASLDQLLADPALHGASVSLMVRDARSGNTLYQHNPRTRLTPASSLKLLTTAAAMDVLGPQYRFSTQLLSDGIRQGAVLDGNLYLRGLGDPTIQWADYQALAANLAQQGIVVQGRRMIGGVTPTTATVLALHESAPLQELITPLLKLSNNNMSEALLKSMGRKTVNAGTAPAGVAAVAGFLKRQGIDTATLNQVDGSGLSRRNLVSSQNLTDVLLAASKQPWFNAWYNALPVAGNPQRLVGGSLRYRLRGSAAENNLHGKTGSMSGVSSLTGYVTDANGRKLVFSMVTNNYVVAGARVKALENRLATALANSTDY